jgi:hypothetical protein
MTYSIGDIFKYVGDSGFLKGYYILAQVGCGEVCLICLEDGNRITEPEEVREVDRISKKVFKELCGNSGIEAFKKVELDFVERKRKSL